MYWVYLLIFILVILTPEMVREGSFGMGREQTEELFIFIWGTIGFFIFLFKEHQASKFTKERVMMQRKINQISKDLTQSYSYIGELNRKIEIIKETTIIFPKNSIITPEKEKQIFKSFLQSITTLSGSDQVCLGFIDSQSGKAQKDFCSSAKLLNSPCISLHEFTRNKTICDREDYLVVKSAKSIDGIYAQLVIAKKKNSRFEDVEFINMLVNQVLFFYAVVNKLDGKAQTED